MHYRKYTRNGQLSAKGGLTLAIRHVDNELIVAMAECGRNDLFNRKMGRTIAEGRLAHALDETVFDNNFGKNVFRLELPAETTPKSFIHNQSFVQERVKKLLAGGK